MDIHKQNELMLRAVEYIEEATRLSMVLLSPWEDQKHARLIGCLRDVNRQLDDLVRQGVDCKNEVA